MFSKSDLPDIAEREQAFELHRVWEELADKAHELFQNEADPEAIRLADAKRNEAEEALADCGIALESDDEGNAVRCAICDAPIRVGDETLFDYDTGEHVLRVAIGLPPRNQEEKELLPDVEDVA